MAKIGEDIIDFVSESMAPKLHQTSLGLMTDTQASIPEEIYMDHEWIIVGNGLLISFHCLLLHRISDITHSLVSEIVEELLLLWPWTWEELMILS